MPSLPLSQEPWLLPDETGCQSYVTIAWHRSSLSRNHLVSISGFHGEDPGGTGLLSASGLRCLSHKTGPGLRTYASFPGPLGPARIAECLPRSYNLPCKYGHPIQNKQNPVTRCRQKCTLIKCICILHCKTVVILLSYKDIDSEYFERAWYNWLSREVWAELHIEHRLCGVSSIFANQKFYYFADY